LNRTEYFREYRKKNPQKIREIKQRYHEKNLQKHCQWSKDYYYRTKNSLNKGKVVAIAGKISGLSASTMYKVKVISDFATTDFIQNMEKDKMSTHKAFQIIQKERKQAYNQLLLLMVKENFTNPTKSETLKIFKKFSNLKIPDFD
jgi:hypothetical protein